MVLASRDTTFCSWRHQAQNTSIATRVQVPMRCQLRHVSGMNPVVAHGVCLEHQQRLLESFPSRPFPGVELLIIVRRNGTALSESLDRAYAATPRVKVLVDRRVGERRSASREVVIDGRLRCRWRATDDARSVSRRRQPGRAGFNLCSPWSSLSLCHRSLCHRSHAVRYSSPQDRWSRPLMQMTSDG